MLLGWVALSSEESVIGDREPLGSHWGALRSTPSVDQAALTRRCATNDTEPLSADGRSRLRWKCASLGFQLDVPIAAGNLKVDLEPEPEGTRPDLAKLTWETDR